MAESSVPTQVGPATEAGRTTLKWFSDNFDWGADEMLLDIEAIEEEASGGAVGEREEPLDFDSDDFRDAHERAMREHIFDKKVGWPHRRLYPPLNQEGTTMEADGCDDLCSDDIVNRLAARLSVNEGGSDERV